MSADTGGQGLDSLPPWVDKLAQQFHESYERMAPIHQYQTRKESAVPWADVPQQNKDLMRSVVFDLFENLVGSRILIISKSTAKALREKS